VVPEISCRTDTQTEALITIHNRCCEQSNHITWNQSIKCHDKTPVTQVVGNNKMNDGVTLLPTTRPTTKLHYKQELECGQVPNVMAALQNMGGPTSWNSLPDSLKDINLSLQTCKRHLKTFLFSTYSTSTFSAFEVSYTNAVYKSTVIIIMM